MLAWYWSLGIVSVLWNYFAVFEHSETICFCVDLLQVLDAHLEPLFPLLVFFHLTQSLRVFGFVLNGSLID